MAERTTQTRRLGVEVEIEPEKSIGGAVAKPAHYAHFFIDALLSNEDVMCKFFLRYPEVARVQFFVDDLIRMDLRRPDGVEEETRKTLAMIGEKLFGLKPDGPAAQKDYRKMLEEVGGWDNELASVSAGGVREVVEAVESLRAQVADLSSQVDTAREILRPIRERVGAREGEDILTAFERKMVELEVDTPANRRFEVECDERLNPPEVIADGRLNAKVSIDLDALNDQHEKNVEALFVCPKCEAEHSRGPVNGAESFRCLKCGYVGPRAEQPSPGVDEYPREVVCLNCDEVVAYATAAAVHGETMKAEDVVRTDGTRPEKYGIVCRACGEDYGGPFWLRDRVTGEWIGEPPSKE